MIVLDTTVLVYAKGGDHPLRVPCRSLFEAVEQGDLIATTTVEVIQEFVHARARRYGRENAVELALGYTEGLAPLLVVEETDLREGLRLFEQDTGLGSFDAVLAAAARSISAILVSADKAFAEVPNLAHVFPDEDGVRHLLP